MFFQNTAVAILCRLGVRAGEALIENELPEVKENIFWQWQIQVVAPNQQNKSQKGLL